MSEEIRTSHLEIKQMRPDFLKTAFESVIKDLRSNDKDYEKEITKKDLFDGMAKKLGIGRDDFETQKDYETYMQNTFNKITSLDLNRLLSRSLFSVGETLNSFLSSMKAIGHCCPNLVEFDLSRLSLPERVSPTIDFFLN